jgi:hypothetical protein
MVQKHHTPTFEMTPNKPTETSAALNRSSPRHNLSTLAYCFVSPAATTKLNPITWSCTAPPRPHHELPWEPVLNRPPMLTPSQYGDATRLSPADSTRSIMSLSPKPESTMTVRFVGSISIPVLYLQVVYMHNPLILLQVLRTIFYSA